MKKQLLLATMIMLGVGAFAQSGIINSTRVPVTTKKALPSGIEDPSRTMTCTNDTLYYSYMKEAIQAAPSYGYIGLVAGSASMGSGYAQAYTNTSTATISGVSFWGLVVDDINPAQSLNVTVGIYNVNATKQPTTSLGTATMTISTDVDQFYNVNFTVPITVLADYAVVITNLSTTDTLGIIVNNATTTTYAEGLGSIQYAGTWYAASALFPAPYAFEPILSPIVSYPIATDFIASAATICQGASVTFTNTTTPTGHLTNRMYNWNIFRDYFNFPSAAVVDSTFGWNFGDLTAPAWATSTSHVYATAGAFSPTLYTFGGFWNSCTDSKVGTAITVNPSAVSSYTYNSTASPTIAFTSTSTDATTYSWDFGDASPADLTANPSHTYAAPGTYTVVLTVTNSCNTSTSSQVITILSTDINSSAAAAGVSVYPNPSTGLFTVELNTSEKASIQVYNVVGKLVYSAEASSAKNSIDLSALAPGVYSLRVISETNSAVKQITITK